MAWNYSDDDGKVDLYMENSGVKSLLDQLLEIHKDISGPPDWAINFFKHCEKTFESFWRVMKEKNEKWSWSSNGWDCELYKEPKTEFIKVSLKKNGVYYCDPVHKETLIETFGKGEMLILKGFKQTFGRK